MGLNTKKKPELVYKEGKPVSVILEIKQYEEMLERLDDLDDLKYINEMKKKGPSFRGFNEFLKEHKDIA
jgi:hypothetical protein